MDCHPHPIRFLQELLSHIPNLAIGEDEIASGAIFMAKSIASAGRVRGH